MSRQTFIGLAILLVFAVLCGTVNYQRWGNPLQFVDLRTHISFIQQPSRAARLAAHGEFDINRLWYGALYYFFPIWTIIRSDGQFLFSEFETGTFNGVELPPSSFLLSDPLLLILGGAAVLKLPQLRRGRLLDLRAVAALMIGFSIPIFLMMIAMGMSLRYRMEFFPLLEFAAYLGFYAICIKPDHFSESYRKGLAVLLIASAGFGIVFSHLLLFLYKISNFGDYAHPSGDTHPVSAAEGWLGYYCMQLKAIFPSIAEKLRW